MLAKFTGANDVANAKNHFSRTGCLAPCCHGPLRPLCNCLCPIGSESDYKQESRDLDWAWEDVTCPVLLVHVRCVLLLRFVSGVLLFVFSLPGAVRAKVGDPGLGYVSGLGCRV